MAPDLRFGLAPVGVALALPAGVAAAIVAYFITSCVTESAAAHRFTRFCAEGRTRRSQALTVGYLAVCIWFIGLPAWSVHAAMSNFKAHHLAPD